MSTAFSQSPFGHQPPAPTVPAKRPRDVRLDFFRGLGMFIIFIAHVPTNSWAQVIPARFGFSDATEIFVFCSGMASAVAFGKLFDDRGVIAGLSRVAFRCWQVYWAHIAVFMVCAAVYVAADDLLANGGHYVRNQGLWPFFSETPSHLLGLLTLTYVPGLFNILPMYLVILALLPLVVLVERHFGRMAVAAFILGVYAIGTTGAISLPEQPGTSGIWFFNPFAWQLVFFTGFAFMRGWLPVPPVDRRLMIAAATVLVVLVPFAYVPLVDNVEFFRDGNRALWPLIDKTHFRPLRLVHFLSFAYLVWVLAGEGGRHLSGPYVRICCKVGQQALGVFMAGIVLSQVAGIVLDQTGRGLLATSLVNLAGCTLLVAVAYTAAYFKSQPWVAAKPIPQPRPPRERSEPLASPSAAAMTGGPAE
ncbi:MAG: OpgC domain-containing protein [Hyphomicrobiaceae bacterium]|nr:OpgC domain-containing protein [Hyphomicrobiaceae bacterium]